MDVGFSVDLNHGCGILYHEDEIDGMVGKGERS